VPLSLVAFPKHFQAPVDGELCKEEDDQVLFNVILFWDNFNHAIMILLNWRYAILTHMSVTVVAPTCQ
jgi:hypothetical protein